MQVKWLSRLGFETAESSNHNHTPKYRTFDRPIKPGTNPELTLENNSPIWGQRAKSIIWLPLASDNLTAGGIEVTGVAWNDRAVGIETIEISTDRGASWRKTQIENPASTFAWYYFGLRVARRGQCGCGRFVISDGLSATRDYFGRNSCSA